MSTTNEIQISKLHITTQDGVMIQATYFVDSTRAIKQAILIASATAVPQRFYSNFARYLAEHNCAVLTFDFRGVGESTPETGLRRFSASLIDWGTKDIPTSLSFLREKHPDIPIHLVGHSAGAQLIGLVPECGKLRSALMVSASSGYVPRLAASSIMKALFVFCLYAPICTALFGYVPGRKIGLGEDLPSGVVQQWAKWCLNRGYVENSFGKEIKTHYYDQIDIPILALTPSDDEIATDKNVLDFMRLMPNAKIEYRKLEPAEFNLKSIGHLNFFRKQSQALWPIAIEWLARNE